MNIFPPKIRCEFFLFVEEPAAAPEDSKRLKPTPPDPAVVRKQAGGGVQGGQGVGRTCPFVNIEQNCSDLLP